MASRTIKECDVSGCRINSLADKINTVNFHIERARLEPDDPVSLAWLEHYLDLCPLHSEELLLNAMDMLTKEQKKNCIIELVKSKFNNLALRLKF